MNYGIGISTFTIGMVLSIAAGAVFNDGGIAAATAVCYVGAILAGIFYGHNNNKKN